MTWCPECLLTVTQPDASHGQRGVPQHPLPINRPSREDASRRCESLSSSVRRLSIDVHLTIIALCERLFAYYDGYWRPGGVDSLHLAFPCPGARDKVMKIGSLNEDAKETDDLEPGCHRLGPMASFHPSHSGGASPTSRSCCLRPRGTHFRARGPEDRHLRSREDARANRIAARQ